MIISALQVLLAFVLTANAVVAFSAIARIPSDRPD